MNDEWKQVILIRTDLNLSKGKTAAQTAHASLEAWKSAGKEAKKKWEKCGGKKVVLKVGGEDELFRIKESAEDLGLPTALITDRGCTEVPPGTVTALGVGPGKSPKIDKVTGSLSLME